MPLAEVVTLYDTDVRDTAGVLRNLADAIEDGEYGDVSTVGVVVMGDEMHCFSAGNDSEAAMVALLFNAAALRLARAVEELGR